MLMCACICIYLSGSLFRVWMHGTKRCFGRNIQEVMFNFVEKSELVF